MMKIGIIGCGNMGAAIIKAVHGPRHQRSGGQAQSTVHSYDIDKKRLGHISRRYRTQVAAHSAELARNCGIIILAVKPQDIRELLHDIKGELNSSKLLISIAAGISTKRIEQETGKKVAVIRVMPNMPALIQAGISAICRGRFASDKDAAAAKRLLGRLGEVVEVKESLMDAVTAISGSGPAYFFHLIEVLVKSGEELGLKKTVARKLAVETALGSARMLKETGDSPENLRARVSSRGGTTEAAFTEFFKHDLEIILKRGIRKAYEKARSL